MNNDGGKKIRTARIVSAFILIVSIALGVWAFYRFNSPQNGDYAYVFDGWIYGREDQKKASAALAEAGLIDYSWNNGKLSAPPDKKGEYQKVLASAGAYPKAPSELRVDAVREMNVFESESKTRLRELNACAQQLERTVEQMRGVDYATVGVRSRREQVGLVAKNVVTASVGVACVEEYKLDLDMLAAITIATKHQLGIDDVANISIIDLKEGKSYFGIESAVGSCSDVALVAEKERIEKYWRDKYLDTFSDIKNLRVSVNAEVAYSDPRVEEQQNDNGVEDATPTISSTSFVEGVRKVERIVSDVPQPLAAAPVKGRFETLGDLVEASELNVEIDCDNQTNETSDCFSSNAGKDCNKTDGKNKGFALLGNPSKSQTNSVRPRKSRPNSSIEDRNSLPLFHVSLQPPERFHWLDGVTHSTVFPVFSSALSGGEFCSSDVVESASEKKLISPAIGSGFNVGRDLASTANNVDCFELKPMAALRRADEFAPVAAEENEALSGTLSRPTLLLSITVHIAVPRSYLRGMTLNGTTSPETFANDRENEILSEIKRFAIELFRPTSERLGWTDQYLDRHFVVSTFSDVDELNASESSSHETTSTHTSYSASYVEQADDGSNDGEKFEKCFNPIVSDNTVSSYGSDNTIAEIAQTVATEIETLAREENEIVDLRNLLKQMSSVWAFVESNLQNPVYRNLGVGLGVAVLGLCFVVWFNRSSCKKRKTQRSRGQLRRKERIPMKDSSLSQSPSPNSREAGKALRSEIDEYMTELDEYDDELEGELQEIVARRGGTRVSPTQNSPVQVKDFTRPSGEYLKKRREVSEVVARNPERAAAALQSWVRNT